MGTNHRCSLHLLVAIITLFGLNLRATSEDWSVEYVETECRKEDLDLSIAVDCKLGPGDDCHEPSVLLPPEGKVLHTFSSRSGDRFNSTLLDDLNYVESDFEKSMDINTTLYVDSQVKYRNIYGFGTSIDLGSNLHDETFIRQLLGEKGLHFSLLVVRLRRAIDRAASEQVSNLKRIDDILRGPRGGQSGTVRLILSLDIDFYIHESTIQDYIETIDKIRVTLESLKVLKCWAIVLPLGAPGQITFEGFRNYMQEVCSKTANVFSRVPMDKAAQHVRGLSTVIGGLYVESDFVSSYDNLRQVLSLKNDLSIITKGSMMCVSGEHGSWKVAQAHAVEIMNHLKHDSSGYIESGSIIHVFSPNPSLNCLADGSLYDLGPGYGSYLKGPLFYATAHFSKHLPPNSRRLNAEVQTQPNMFAANYVAFMTPQKYAVAIALNDNEHDLPFRVAINKRIRAHVMVKSKSFNTFVMKI